MPDPYDTVPIETVAEKLGIPAVQLARWCADGTVPKALWTGSVVAWRRLRFDGAWVRAQIADLGEVVLQDRARAHG